MSTMATARAADAAAQVAAASARIRVRGLAKRYGTLEVFRGIDFDVGEREIVTIVGPSGCGKTTLLRCIDGLLPVDDGEIWCGRRARDGADRRHGDGVPALRSVSVEDRPRQCRLRAADGRRASAEIAERVPHFIKMVGLAGFENAYPYQMSGGMQQRCGLARALAVEPSVLLMDEPFAAVDAQTREILQFELLRIWETRPTSMIFVTHSIEEAVLMGDRVFVLKGRPSNIQKVVAVDLPRPRTRETLRRRASPSCASWCGAR